MQYDPCPNYSLFQISYSNDLITAFEWDFLLLQNQSIKHSEILIASYIFYYNIVPYFAPANIAANLFAAILLLAMWENCDAKQL